VSESHPAHQLRLADVDGDRLDGAPGNGFRERDIQVIAVGRAAVVGAQLGEHVAVAVDVQDAFDGDGYPASRA
jgi:hypothetical protein